jgi:hypothetical protein
MPGHQGGVSAHAPTASPSRLRMRQPVIQGGPGLRSNWSHRPQVEAILTLAERATRVPEAAVTSGIQRTVTVTPRRPLGRARVSDLGWGGGRNCMACKRSARQRPATDPRRMVWPDPLVQPASFRPLPDRTYRCFTRLDQLRLRRTTDSRSDEADVGCGPLGRLERGRLVTRARGPPAKRPRARIDL